MILSFTFDAVPIIQSHTDQPLLEPNVHVCELRQIEKIHNDFSAGGSTWTGYEDHVTTQLLRYNKKEKDDERSYMIPADTYLDADRIRIRQTMFDMIYRSDIPFDEPLFARINQNAHFFKHLIEMRMPRTDQDMDSVYPDSFPSGVASARPITIKLFEHCQEEHIPKLTAEGAGFSEYIITKKGLLCTGVDGKHFVILSYSDVGAVRSTMIEVDLALPF